MNYRERLPSSRYSAPILKPHEIQLPITLLNQSCSDFGDFMSASPLAKCCAALITSKNNGTLYIGATSDLIKRVWQHKNKLVDGFTKKYNITNLIYFEETQDVESAIKREKKLKKWNRAWKIRLIEENNPNWDDLYDSLTK